MIDPLSSTGRLAYSLYSRGLKLTVTGGRRKQNKREAELRQLFLKESCLEKPRTALQSVLLLRPVLLKIDCL